MQPRQSKALAGAETTECAMIGANSGTSVDSSDKPLSGGRVNPASAPSDPSCARDLPWLISDAQTCFINRKPPVSRSDTLVDLSASSLSPSSTMFKCLHGASSLSSLLRRSHHLPAWEGDHCSRQSPSSDCPLQSSAVLPTATWPALSSSCMGM